MYAGSIATPHGLASATKPALKAKAKGRLNIIRPSYTGSIRARHYPYRLAPTAFVGIEAAFLNVYGLLINNGAGHQPLCGFREHGVAKSQDVPYTLICYRIEDVAATPICVNKTTPAKAGKVTGNPALRCSEHLYKFRDAAF